LLLLALPAWTVPALQQAFSGLPQEHYGPWSRWLFAFASHLRQWGILLPLILIAATAGALYRLPRGHGHWRDTMDRYGTWRLYRQVQALRLIALMAILLQPGIGQSSQLRPVVSLFLPGARPWLAQHLRQ